MTCRRTFEPMKPAPPVRSRFMIAVTSSKGCHIPSLQIGEEGMGACVVGILVVLHLHVAGGNLRLTDNRGFSGTLADGIRDGRTVQKLRNRQSGIWAQPLWRGVLQASCGTQFLPRAVRLPSDQVHHRTR